ncbi:hypothetical protein L1987_20562 [Smallanthus sonchifolius]|uniref:Uncharacterized protein n=1 Tax=Smallanthus sonchifolius TaxID=185202 RepID=A0ACB9ITT8_9ASTR|nr:hypothetical protein L1987_20562 [Smallanthus sonchifolius]
MALPLDEVKRLMTEEFCPRNEVKKLEAEFWDLAQDSGESLAYTTRFHELSLLMPHMVTPLSRCIEKYIGGLPRQIQDTVLGRNPATLEDAIRLSATLTDNHVKAGTLTKKGSKKVSETVTPPTHNKEATTEPSRNNRKRKVRNFAVVTPTVPVNQAAPMVQTPAKKPYVGIYPLCATCNYHHPQTIPCRLCTHCGRYGHTINVCRAKVLAGQVHPPNRTVPQVANQGAPAIANGRACFSSNSSYRMKIPYMRDYSEKRSCFSCGLIGHIRIACPHKAKGNRHVTPEKVRTPVKPYVNPNVVKPRDKPKGNSKSEVRLSRPQRRRRNRRLRKLLEHQEFSQSTHFSNERKFSNTSHFKQKELNEKKYVWKSKVSISDSSEQSLKIDERFDCEWSEVYYFDTDGRPMTTMAWVPISN